MKKNRFIFTAVFLFGLLLPLTSYADANRVSATTKNKLNKELPIFKLRVGNDVLLRSFKKESRLELWMRPDDKEEYILFRTYPICYYSGRLGPKIMVGDKVTPEGFYEITKKRMNPASRFHLSMNIGYPNKYDLSHGRTGSLIMVHGACDAVGCFAMSNKQIEEIYYLTEQALKKGQEVIQYHSFPFRLTINNLMKHKQNYWYSFWTELKSGYDEFKKQKKPLSIEVKDKHYVIDSFKTTENRKGKNGKRSFEFSKEF